MATIREQNRSLLNKTVDSFYVSFYGISANASNILGRQVKSIERPVINFNTHDIIIKGIKQHGNGTLFFEPISIVFLDDINSITNFVLYDQLMHQTGKKQPSFEDSKFSVNVKCFDATENVIEEFTLLGCFIQMLQHSEQIFSESTSGTLTVQLQFDNVDYKFPEYDTGSV